MRFLLGGRHGEFKFVPPPGYAPCYEAVLPKDRLCIEPIKEYINDMNKDVKNLLGPTQSLSHTAFTPNPVDTVQVRARCLRALITALNLSVKTYGLIIIIPLIHIYIFIFIFLYI